MLLEILQNINKNILSSKFYLPYSDLRKKVFTNLSYNYDFLSIGQYDLNIWLADLLILNEKKKEREEKKPT